MIDKNQQNFHLFFERIHFNSTTNSITFVSKTILIVFIIMFIIFLHKIYTLIIQLNVCGIPNCPVLKQDIIENLTKIDNSCQQLLFESVFLFQYN